MQGGAGTSSNMNMNEVIANRALEIAGRQRGDYIKSPLLVIALLVSGTALHMPRLCMIGCSRRAILAVLVIRAGA